MRTRLLIALAVIALGLTWTWRSTIEAAVRPPKLQYQTSVQYSVSAAWKVLQ